MRKMHQQQALEFVKLLEEANKEIRTSIEKRDIAGAQGLLADCQDGAIELGNLIEKTEGEGFPGIPLIERYCELLYQAHEGLGRTEDHAGKLYKTLRQQLIKIENSIKYDVKIRKEIVFLPYKASMWDSLESVWRAADADPDCDAYVIPIPYYDKNPDGSFREMHYEGTQFPKDVPVTFYQDYDFEKRRPDVVFIHNPYDQYNYVTSVEPRFYSIELKKYTELLVYIPYFVCDEQSMNTVIGKYTATGVQNADVVVLQSENLRHKVIELLRQRVGGDRKYWENRVVGLGSPKYDPVFGLDKEQQIIPENWKKIIQKQDGSNKKIVLYNTGVGPMLTDSVKMIAKIRTVLAFFYEYREEYVLLWRPHPLYMATLKSMRPQLLTEYREIVEEFVSGGWGIYDDTSDFHAAFALSDVYYGDYSSLVWLYQASGKPLLEQNTDILEYQRRRFVTSCLYYDGEYIWGTALEFNGLFRVHLRTYQVEYVGQFPEEKAEGFYLYNGIAEYNEKLYFCPYNAKHIAVYDKRTSTFHTICLRESIRNGERKFSDIMVDGKYIYFKGRNVDAIIRLDAETTELIYIENWVNEMRRRQMIQHDFLLQAGCVYHDDLYYFSQGARGLLRMALSDFSYEFIPLQYSHQDGYFRVVHGGDLLWLLPARDGCLACYDPQTGNMTALEKISHVVDFCIVGNYGYCFSATEPYFHRIHIKTMKVTSYPIEKGVWRVCAAEDKIFMTSYLTGEWYVLDTISLNITKGILFWNEKQYPRHNMREMLQENQIYNRYARESGFINLGNLMDAVSESGRKQTVFEGKSYGAVIYEYVKGLEK